MCLGVFVCVLGVFMCVCFRCVYVSMCLGVFMCVCVLGVFMCVCFRCFCDLLLGMLHCTQQYYMPC